MSQSLDDNMNHLSVLMEDEPREDSMKKSDEERSEKLGYVVGL